MKVLKGLDNIPEEFRGAIVTIGNFDGVHLGHRLIFKKIAAEAFRKKCKAVVITFEPHPKMILHPDIQPFYLITSSEEKIERIAETGVDGLMLIPFSLVFSKMTAKEFICSVLWDKLRIKKIFIGHDYTFGKGKEGNETYLAAFGEKLGFQVEVIRAFEVVDTVISSTLTRNMILEGSVKKAAAFLGRPYSLSGTVIKGHHRNHRAELFFMINPHPVIHRREDGRIEKALIDRAAGFVHHHGQDRRLLGRGAGPRRLLPRQRSLR